MGLLVYAVIQILIFVVVIASFKRTSEKAGFSFGKGLMLVLVISGVLIWIALHNRAIREGRIQPSQASLQTVRLEKQVPAFDRSAPHRKIGFFKAASELQVGPLDAESGMRQVSFQHGNKTVDALCREEDLFPPGK